MKKPDPVGVGDILSKMTKSTQLGASLEQAKIWNKWESLVGPKMSQHGRPVSIKDGTLTVEVDASVWMHRFTLRKWTILQLINRMAGKELVSDLYITLLEDGRDLSDNAE